MKRGPKPKLHSLKVRLGTFRHDRGLSGSPRNDDRTAGHVPLSAPTWLSPLALEEWHRVVSVLEQQGRVALVDASMLASYCTEFATYRRLTSWLEQQGHVVILPNGIAAMRPEAKLADTALKNAMKLAAEFGLTPSSRSRAHVDIPQEAPDWRQQLA